MSKLEVQTFKSINEIDANVWNKIVAGRGFQSHNWYQFGEKAMAECEPTYLLVRDGEKPIASAALFKVHNEPLPLPSVAKRFMASILKRRPLLVCRSPLADTSALLLPGEPMRDEALTVLAKAAQKEFKRQRCSFLIFDYLLTEQLRYPGWPSGYEAITVSEPGTYMALQWQTFTEYVKEGLRDNPDYENSRRSAEQNGFELVKSDMVTDVEKAVQLIRNVSIWQGSATNPWTRGMLDNFSMIDGTWLEIRKDGQMVGCGAVLRDNRFQLTTALGLEDDVPDGYSLLLYAALEDAFAHDVRLVRFGTGSYDIKRKLGLHLEDTNHAMATIASAGTPVSEKAAASSPSSDD